MCFYAQWEGGNRLLFGNISTNINLLYLVAFITNSVEIKVFTVTSNEPFTETL